MSRVLVLSHGTSKLEFVGYLEAAFAVRHETALYIGRHDIRLQSLSGIEPRRLGLESMLLLSGRQSQQLIKHRFFVQFANLVENRQL